MPSPPISPTPRRWRSPLSSEPHPDYAALLSTFDGSSSSEGSTRGFPGWRSAPESPSRNVRSRASSAEGSERRDVEEDTEAEGYLTAPVSPEKSSTARTPEIRTTPPTPQRAGQPASPTFSARSTEGRLSPLPLPPPRGELFGEDPASTAGRSGLNRGDEPSGNDSGPRGTTFRESCLPVVVNHC